MLSYTITMSIKGGIDVTKKEIIVTLPIDGGSGSYKKVYNDVVKMAINKFMVISTTLSSLLNSNCSETNLVFYVNQIKSLLKYAHVEFIDGNQMFQHKYNIWLLDGYIRMILETNDVLLITQLLNLDSLLRSIEQIKSDDNTNLTIDFKIPSNIKLKPLNKSEKIEIPSNNDLKSCLLSLNNNIALLSKLINLNQDKFEEIYKKIIKTASKYFIK